MAMTPTTSKNLWYRGHRVYYTGHKYPRIAWADHPLSHDGQFVLAHRAVMYDLVGAEAMMGMEVHHRDGDQQNWDPRNLELVNHATHRVKHGIIPASVRPCAVCEADVVVTSRRRSRSRVFCSVTCRAKGQEKIVWPDVETVKRMTLESGYEATGRALGVTGAAVKKHVRYHAR